MIRRLFGAVPYLGSGATDSQAAKAIEDWNAGKLPLLALHPASGGHGLNLQYGGSRMAWISPTWSAELWDQTIARIHRPGQTAHVMVHVCCAAGTVDELTRLRVIQKLSAQTAFERYLASRSSARKAA
jgi:SNF2 family DNA or RNA helicase